MSEMILETLDNEYELGINDYQTIFEILYEEHNSYCKNWLFKNNKTFNLKRNYICDIYNTDRGIEETFKGYLDSYLGDLSCLYFEILGRIYKRLGFYLRGRTKEYTSIIYKLHKKVNEDNGKFGVIKCLNDLLGFRIIDKNYNRNIEVIKRYLECLYQNDYRIKHMDRNNIDYKGYHVYFLGQNNCMFPIELQIWSHKDEQNNLDSHKIYKQEYIDWIEKYKDI